MRRGAYIVADADSVDAIVIATGSEVQLAIAARTALAQEGVGVRVVSMPSRELFEQQDAAYREAVLPRAVRTRVAVEAGASLGWFAYVGLDGAVVGIDRFGASAPGPDVFRDAGLTGEAVARAVQATIARNRNA